jgi:NTP pyrophosphatase (non-canonical NTP hydrolase)
MPNYDDGPHPLGINAWSKLIGDWGKRKGWHLDSHGVPLGKDTIPEKLMLVVTEVAEAMEEYRKPGLDITDIYTPDRLSTDRIPWTPDTEHAGLKPEGFGIELADIVIRVFHLAGLFGINLEECVRTKMAYNERRSYRHGDKRA